LAKNGLKLKPSADQTSPDASDPASSLDGEPPHGSVMMGPGIIVANAVFMTVLAKVLTQEMERRVFDRTNLIGRFDIRPQWMPDVHPAGGADAQAAVNTSDYGLRRTTGAGTQSRPRTRRVPCNRFRRETLVELIRLLLNHTNKKASA
jgi:uncharacterized protein (TIGR03435 family)